MIRAVLGLAFAVALALLCTATLAWSFTAWPAAISCSTQAPGPTSISCSCGSPSGPAENAVRSVPWRATTASQASARASRLTRAGRRMDSAIHEPGRAPAAT